MVGIFSDLESIPIPNAAIEILPNLPSILRPNEVGKEEVARSKRRTVLTSLCPLYVEALINERRRDREQKEIGKGRN